MTSPQHEPNGSAEREMATTLNVKVTCYGGLREYLPSGADSNCVIIRVPKGSSVADVLHITGIPERLVFSLLVEGMHASSDRVLSQDAHVVVMPPFAGGSRWDAAVVTVSDAASEGRRTDDAGGAVEDILRASGAGAVSRILVPDEPSVIEKELRALVDARVAVVVTTGGTGFSPRDVTPEASRNIVEKDAPGLAELMRTTGLAHTRTAALSRGICGIAGGSLIINVPGSTAGARQSLEAIIHLIPHALDLISGRSSRHPDEGHPRLTASASERGARMVDVTKKGVTAREAVASCFIHMTQATLDAVRSRTLQKGDALEVAKVAGVMAAKRTAELIPLCHPISLGAVEVELVPEPTGVSVTATVRTNERTGVEMEALTAVTAAALAVYDMVKSLERGVRITDVRLERKSGGRSGQWVRDERVP